MSPPITPAEEDTLLTYEPGKGRGHVECVALKVTLPGGSGLWLGLGVSDLATGRGAGAVAEGWAIAYGRAGDPSSHVALRQTWPYRELRQERGCFFVEVGPLQWRYGATTGALEDEAKGQTIRWDLTFTTEHVGYAGAGSGRATPQVDSRVSGWLEVDGVRSELADAPACLTHTWGRARPEGWARVHCNAWSQGEAIALEGITTKAKLGPLSPRRTALHVRIRGERIDIDGRLRARTRQDGLAWSFAGQRGDRRVEGVFSGSPERSVGANRYDGDGRVVRWLATPSASGELRVLAKEGGKWVPFVTARADCSAWLEVGSRSSTHGVKLYLL